MDPLVPWLIAELLLAVFAVILAYRLRDVEDPGHGGDEFDIVLPPDPGGLSTDWDAELQDLINQTRKVVL